MDRGHALDLGRSPQRESFRRRVAAWLDRPRRRREADQLLRASAGKWESHPRVAWRVAELTSPRERRLLVRTLRSIVAEARDPRPALTASVLARRRLSNHLGELTLLADRLGDLDRPVTAAGIVLVHDLLTDGGSPLYIAGDADALVPAIDRIHDLLEAA